MRKATLQTTRVTGVTSSLLHDHTDRSLLLKINIEAILSDMFITIGISTVQNVHINLDRSESSFV